MYVISHAGSNKIWLDLAFARIFILTFNESIDVLDFFVGGLSM